ncbi:putative calcineurin-binding protein cabin-1 [Apostichopus japonicus]|uniref:Putative calcineurin-binding protein cabin-1 n=1 Tax=Stichopus japonicus TaxID=307972 RepID=A0A2G8L543_STIJA|nr:putative calcineurin-binding protein cabin-1 [Apostichopus japonicus]
MQRAEKKPETAAVAEIEKKEEPVPMDTKEKEKEASVAGPQTEELSAAERFKRLVEQSISAMHLCLQRFPQHYKSLYRIAHWHLTSATEKNLQWCRDLLLGSALPWQQTSHMPSPALFGEHNKTKNIFQGIWRIPIADIDRSGSFSWHMYRSVTLLIEVLEELKDEAMLLQLATKLARTPEQGKKFLRDSDRPHLATRPIRLARSCWQRKLKGIIIDRDRVIQSTDENMADAVSGSAITPCCDSKVASKLLTAVYKSYKGKEIEDEPSVYDQASRFCQHVVNTSKLPQTPTQGDYHRFVRPGHLGSPVKAPSSPGPGKSFEKINQPPTSDKGPPQRSLTTASQGPASQVKKSPEVPLGSSFLMSSILAPDSERKKSNQGMRTVPYLDERDNGNKR